MSKDEIDLKEAKSIPSIESDDVGLLDAYSKVVRRHRQYLVTLYRHNHIFYSALGG